MNFTERIKGMITRPDDTTRDIAVSPRLEEGLMVVGVYIILTVISTYIAFTRVRYTGSVGGIDASSLATAMLVAELAAAIVLPLLSWPIVAGVAHFLSMFFGGNGKFYPNMMTLIGYTNIPLLVVLVLSMILTLLTPVTVVDFSAVAQATTSSLLSSPIRILSMVIGLLGSIWVAYMMAFAVKNGENLPMKNAAIVVGVLFVANLVITYGSVVLTLLAG
jgi:hypothetical protein